MEQDEECNDQDNDDHQRPAKDSPGKAQIFLKRFDKPSNSFAAFVKLDEQKQDQRNRDLGIGVWDLKFLVADYCGALYSDRAPGVNGEYYCGALCDAISRESDLKRLSKQLPRAGVSYISEKRIALTREISNDSLAVPHHHSYIFIWQYPVAICARLDKHLSRE